MRFFSYAPLLVNKSLLNPMGQAFICVGDVNTFNRYCIGKVTEVKLVVITS